MLFNLPHPGISSPVVFGLQFVSVIRFSSHGGWSVPGSSCGGFPDGAPARSPLSASFDLKKAYIFHPVSCSGLGTKNIWIQTDVFPLIAKLMERGCEPGWKKKFPCQRVGIKTDQPKTKPKPKPNFSTCRKKFNFLRTE